MKLTWKSLQTIHFVTFNVWTMFWAIKVSSPEVGSSQKKIGGLVRASDAKERRFRSPPEIPFLAPPGEPILLEAHFDKPIWCT